jgi:hypothetical protein
VFAINDHTKIKFDKEYSTQWNEERDYLLKQGIKYTFVKEVNGVSTYKYKKNSKLFNALGSFYIELENK